MLEKQQAEDLEYERNALKKQMSLKLLRRSSAVIAHEETARNSLERNKARAGLVVKADDA